jgi:hypothetical protein
MGLGSGDYDSFQAIGLRSEFYKGVRVGWAVLNVSETANLEV